MIRVVPVKGVVMSSSRCMGRAFFYPIATIGRKKERKKEIKEKKEERKKERKKDRQTYRQKERISSPCRYACTECIPVLLYT